MVRGGQRGRGRKRSSGHHNLTKEEKKHWKQYGEKHPADERYEPSGKMRKVDDAAEKFMKHEPQIAESSSSDSEDEPSAYQTLMSTFSSKLTEDHQDSSSEEESTVEQLDLVSSTGEGNSEEENSSEEDAAGEADQHSRDGEDVEEEVDDGDGEGDEDGEEDEEEDEEDKGDELLEDDYRLSTFIAEEEENPETEALQKADDPFTRHFECDIEEDLADSLAAPEGWQKNEIEVSGLGRCICTTPKKRSPFSDQTKEKDLLKLYVKKNIADQVPATNKKYVHPDKEGALTKLQQSLFSVLNRYQDLNYPERSHEHGEEIRMVYCLHALNHVLKTRSRVIAHNAKLKSKEDEHMHDYRDQGLTRPKVLIVVPFRDSALKIVNMMDSLVVSDKESVTMNKKRFEEAFCAREYLPKGKKPEDHDLTFAGNIDDHFRIGLGIAKKSIKLYTTFYRSDIIISSPLGLRTVIGALGEQNRDFDFLSSVEMLIFDQVDIFSMQNWDHVMHLMSHMHLQPKESHGVDFSRVRMWTLNGWSKFYRQTLMFSSVVTPEINALFNKHCHNFDGKLQLLKPHASGSICHIVTTLPQVFHRISVNAFAEVPDARFEFFKSKILPQYKDKMMARTLIFIPSYYDFVRIRNYMKKEELSTQKLCEYTPEKSMTRARSFFYYGRTHFLLYTERLHFYRRFRIKGIRHIIFYELPTYPHFYSELANMTIDPQKKRKIPLNFTCEVLYTKYDAHKLSAVVGTDRAGNMVHSDKSAHMFMSGDT